MTSLDPVRVLIVDDHELFASSLKLVLDRLEAVDCVGIAHDGLEAVSLALELDADVVLMDVSLPEIDGFEAARRLLARRNSARVIAMSGHDEADLHDRIVTSGMVSFLSKDHISDSVLAAIMSAASPPGL